MSPRGETLAFLAAYSPALPLGTRACIASGYLAKNKARAHSAVLSRWFFPLTTSFPVSLNAWRLATSTWSGWTWHIVRPRTRLIALLGIVYCAGRGLNGSVPYHWLCTLYSNSRAYCGFTPLLLREEWLQPLGTRVKGTRKEQIPFRHASFSVFK